MSKYNLSAQCLVITTNINNNQVFILSLNPENIIFPSIEINNKNIDNLSNNIVEFMRTFLMTHELELAPQLITTDIKLISSSKKNTLNLIYGFLIKEGIKNFNSHWIELDFLNMKSPYAPIILEVIQKLK
ncbi:hypothetical protein EBS40_02545 [bacterium]|nr:hypothetical protein [bacterium]